MATNSLLHLDETATSNIPNINLNRRSLLLIIRRYTISTTQSLHLPTNNSSPHHQHNTNNISRGVSRLVNSNGVVQHNLLCPKVMYRLRPLQVHHRTRMSITVTFRSKTIPVDLEAMLEDSGRVDNRAARGREEETIPGPD